MTIGKTSNVLRGDRTPAYVDRETGAAELGISPDTWDQWVKAGRIPPASPGFPAGSPRWRWQDVDARLAGKSGEDGAAFSARVVNLRGHGPKKEKRRGAA